MNKSILIILLTIVIGNLSCSRMLDTKPTDFSSPDSYYKTATELQAALNAVYRSLTTQEVYGNNYLYMFNTNTDDSYGRVVENTPSYQYDAADSKNEQFWKGLYLGIFRANMLLERVDAVQMDVDKRNVIKGEALFLRAFMHFMLVSNYGDVPLILKSTVSVTDVDVPRTPMKQVYEQITKDMIAAEDLLKTQTATSLGHGGKITKTAVQGMLARVYLYWAGFPLKDVSKYKEALLWANKVVHPTGNAPEHALNPDYTGIFMNYAKDLYDVKESMWELEFWGNLAGTTNLTNSYCGRFCGIRCTDTQKGAAVAYLKATRKLWDLYEVDPASTSQSLDLRRDWNCAGYYWNGTPAVYTLYSAGNTWIKDAGKWRREYELVSPKDKDFTPQNFPMLRYSDVLLMLAEAENHENGPTALAQDAINQVRRRAYGLLLPTPPKPNVKADVPTTLDPIQFQQYVREERSRELCFEALRRNDLIRWGNFVADMKAFQSYALANGGTASEITLAAGKVSTRNIYLPIPIHDLMLNKALTQNPGY